MWHCATASLSLRDIGESERWGVGAEEYDDSGGEDDVPGRLVFDNHSNKGLDKALVRDGPCHRTVALNRRPTQEMISERTSLVSCLGSVSMKYSSGS